MSAISRIQWIHKKVATGCYPNSSHAVERFGISQRQAQRDFDSLKNDFGAPLKYSTTRRGYYYTKDFVLPRTEEEDTEPEYIDVVADVEETYRDQSDQIQLRMPYSAKLRIRDKLAVMNLRRFIISREVRDVYNCEFYNVDSFLGIIFMSNSDIEIIKPEWLREKIVDASRRVLRNNDTEE